MDTAPVIFTPTDLAQTLRLTDLFPREQPLDLEIGCGKGRFLITTAIRNPDRNFIGIELNPKYIEIAERRIEREVGLLLDLVEVSPC